MTPKIGTSVNIVGQNVIFFYLLTLVDIYRKTWFLFVVIVGCVIVSDCGAVVLAGLCTGKSVGSYCFEP